MLISRYIVEYTSGDRVKLKDILKEKVELLEEVLKFNPKGIKEEWQDVWHFVQLWLYWQFKIDGDVWSFTSQSVEKFKKRVEVWREIYEAAGLEKNISNFCGNYNRKEKVISQLAKFGINSERAIEVYNQVVLKKNGTSG